MNFNWISIGFRSGWRRSSEECLQLVFGSDDPETESGFRPARRSRSLSGLSRCPRGPLRTGSGPARHRIRSTPLTSLLEARFPIGRH